MLKLVKYAILLVLAYFALQTYATYSLGTKFASCLEGEPVKGANRAQMEAISERAIACVDKKANVVDRIWFDKDDALTSLTIQ